MFRCESFIIKFCGPSFKNSFTACKFRQLSITSCVLRRRTSTDGPDMSSITKNQSVSNEEFLELTNRNMKSNVRETMSGLQNEVEEEYQHVGKCYNKRVFNIVKNQYYKEKKEKCLLTWSMILQMRKLYTIDPQNWTGDKFAKHFPVSAEKALNLARATWMLKDEDIEIHDSEVIKMWQTIAKGKLGNPALLESFIKAKSMHDSAAIEPIDNSSRFQNLKFDGEHKIFEASEKDPKNRLYKYKQKKTLPFSFGNIIKDYEEKIALPYKDDQNKNIITQSKTECHHLDRIDDSPRKYVRQKRITFEEYNKMKNK